MALLEIQGLTKTFGGRVAISGLSLNVDEGIIMGLIGPNGAGKTTLFNVITGFFPPTSGKVIFRGEDITFLETHQIARKGIRRTFQASTVFNNFTVFDNVLIALYTDHRNACWKSPLYTEPVREEERIAGGKAIEILNFTGLTSQKDKLAADLSSGNHKLLAISMAFATNPKLLLLDEPVTTLSQHNVERIMELIVELRKAGTTVMIIEHNMKAIMDYCDKITVLAYGKKIAEGLPQEIRENEDVIEAYLGEME